MIDVKVTGDFSNIERVLKNKPNFMTLLNRYGQRGVVALSSNTPFDSGETAGAWSYKVTASHNKYVVSWHNSHMAGSTPVAILLQYGHATKNGGFVQGIDYINPALKPIFNDLAASAWKEVK